MPPGSALLSFAFDLLSHQAMGSPGHWAGSCSHLLIRDGVERPPHLPTNSGPGPYAPISVEGGTETAKRAGMRTHIAAGEPEAHSPSQPSPEVQGSQQVKDPGRQGEALSWGLRHHEVHLKPAHFGARRGAVCQSQPPSAEGQERTETGEFSSKSLSLEPRPNKEPSAALHLLPDSRPVSENSLPCPHPISCCLQGRASSVSPQARILSPSSPHLSLLTLSLLTPLCPRMRASRTAGVSSRGWAPRTWPRPSQSNSHSALSRVQEPSKVGSTSLPGPGSLWVGSAPHGL